VSSTDQRTRTARIVVVVLAVLTLLYSLLVARAPLAWFGTATTLFVLYLLWRFVRAHERIADALAAGVDAETTVPDRPSAGEQSSDE